MEKIFVCLAVSYKYGGRCIGGVEVYMNDEKCYSIVKENDTPKWVRPVTKDTEHGEIPNELAQKFNVLDIIRLIDVEPCGDNAQSENYFFKDIDKVGKVALNSEILNKLCDKRHHLLFGNRGKAVHPDTFITLGYSLMLIQAENVNFFIEKRYNSENERLRVKFSYNDVNYDLPVTDPAFCKKADMYGADNLNHYSRYYFTVSLGVEYEGWHSKLIANVISMD